MAQENLALVDPELLPFLEKIGHPVLNADTLAAARQLRMLPPEQDDGLPVETSDAHVPGMSGDPDVRVLISRPAQPSSLPRPAILHIHGGGFVMGTPDRFLPLQRRWAHELGCVVVSVDYRLAPETPFPGPLDDCYAALVWLAAGNLPDVETSRIGVAGESAGGGLAAGLALLARHRSGPALIFQNLQYPMLDDRTGTTGECNPVTGDFLWTREMNEFGWASYLGVSPGRAGLSPFAAPARERSLAGLPPTWIGCGTLDLFLDEDVNYALRLIRDRVPVEMDIIPGAFHAFDMDTGAAVSQRSAFRRTDAMRRAFAAARRD